MEEQKSIRKSNSPWAFPLCSVMKPNGKVRPCTDYRAINKLTKPGCFPIPNTKDCLDAFAGAKLLSTFNLTAGYHQVPIMEKDISNMFFKRKLIVSKFHNETQNPKGQENKIYTIVKGRETFYRRHTVPITSCSEVKYVL